MDGSLGALVLRCRTRNYTSLVIERKLESFHMSYWAPSKSERNLIVVQKSEGHFITECAVNCDEHLELF